MLRFVAVPVFSCLLSNLTASMRTLTASTSIFVAFKQSRPLYAHSHSLYAHSHSLYKQSHGLLYTTHFFKHNPRPLLAAASWFVASSTLSWPPWQSRASNDPPDLQAESSTLPIEPPFLYRTRLYSSWSILKASGWTSWARICKHLRSPGVDSKESIPTGLYVAWWDGMSYGLSYRLLQKFKNTGSSFQCEWASTFTESASAAGCSDFNYMIGFTYV